MRFVFDKNAEIAIGKVVYSAKGYCFGFEPHIVGGTSILINDVQLEVDMDGYLLYAWGACPYTKWLDMDAEPPPATRARIQVKEWELIPGVSTMINPDKIWDVWVNRKTRWVCVGNYRNLPGSIYVEFASDSIIGFSPALEVISLWLRPISLP